MEKINETGRHFDIREYKKQLRSCFKEKRISMTADEKSEKDRKIFEKLTAMSAYKNAERIFAYVSTGIEVDTLMLMEKALSDGKRVAVPRCIDGTREMDFYYIRSFDDLEKGSFGVLEPKTQCCEKADDLSSGVCIVPGLSFDTEGYRLGYGGGYYDRFLSRYTGLVKIGICYCSCISRKLIRGNFDINTDYVVTEKYVKNTSPKKG